MKESNNPKQLQNGSLKFASRIIGRDVSSTNELTASELNKITEAVIDINFSSSKQKIA